MDGWITIGTELSTDKFDKQIINLEKKMQKAEKKKVRKEMQIQGLEKDIQDYDRAKRKVKEYQQELANLRKEQQYGTPEQSISATEKIKEVAGNLERQNDILNTQEKHIDSTRMKLELMKQEYVEIEQEVLGYKNQIENVDLQRQSAEVQKMKEGFKEVTSSLQDAVKKAGKLALGIFGIRSAYMMLRRASSELASYDEQYAADLEYIRFVLTQAIAPVLKWIVEMAMNLLSFINAIVYALSGVNLFSEGSAENFQKMKAGAGGATKAVKELKKQLMGFDEVNVLTDQSDTGTGAGAGGVGMPSFDLSETSQKMQEFIEKAKGWWKDLGKALDDAVNMPDDTFGNWTEMFRGMALTARGAYKVVDGVLDAIGGSIQVIHGAITGDMEEVEKGSKRLFEGLKNIAMGLLEIVGGAIYTIIGAIGGLFKTIFDFDKIRETLVEGINNIVKGLDREKRGIKDVKKAQEDLNKAKEEATKAYDNYIDAVDRSEEALKRLQEAEEETGLSGEELNKQVEQGILDYKDMTDVQKRVYKAYLDNRNAQDNLKSSTEKMTNATKEQKQASLDNAAAVAYESEKYDEYKNAVVNAYRNGEITAEEARDRIERAMAGMSQSTAETFTQDLPSDISEGLDPNRYTNVWTRFREAWNNWFDGLKRNINFYINGNFSAGGGGGFGGGGSGGRAKGGIFYPNLMKLASGGIINMPGRGALYNGAYIGERGAEAVVPLTDSQQMELLGATIGKYITINANITNEMNGRVISRQLKKVQANQDFAYNT